MRLHHLKTIAWVKRAMVVVLFLSSFTGLAQSTTHEVSLTAALQSLERTYSVIFSFNKMQTDTCRVKHPLSKGSLERDLHSLFIHSDFRYRIVKERYVLVYYEKRDVQSKPETSTQPRPQLPLWHQEVHYERIAVLKEESVSGSQPILHIPETITETVVLAKSENIKAWPVLITNLHYALAAQTPNVGLDYEISSNKTLGFMVGLNPWCLGKSNQKKLTHCMVIPHYKYWTGCSYIGLHLPFTGYDVEGVSVPRLFKKEQRYQGIALGALISYGYWWMVTANFGIDFSVGAGSLWLRYNCYDRGSKTSRSSIENRFYAGHAQVGLAAIYRLGKGRGRVVK